MKIFVAIPVYDGKLGIESVRCLLNEQAVAIGLGDDFTVNFLASDAGIAGARNTLASRFMESGFDKLVFLDSDITFSPGSLVKLAYMPVDFVGGAYRHKIETESYPIQFLPDPDKKGIPMLRCGLLEVSKLPTGFLSLSRKVFQDFEKAFPERKYTHYQHTGHCYFQMPFKDGNLNGEDYFFCKEWTEMGGKIFLDPEIKLTHWNYNPRPHVGHIGDWLKRSSKITEEHRDFSNMGKGTCDETHISTNSLPQGL